MGNKNDWGGDPVASIGASKSAESRIARSEIPTAADSKFLIQAPTLALPKGGGAIRGIGEKFSANPVTGTGAMSVPIALTAGRGGFGPQLTLAYDSGAGNGPYGLGWDIALPAISRKTDKGLPRYLDEEDSDTFLLAGAEDLVRTCLPDGSTIPDENPTAYGTTYRVRCYRPRIEGLFARIERWMPPHGQTAFWRTISRDNVTTWYGRTPDSRIHDPANPAQVFRWLICETHDDKGNVAIYKYKREDRLGVDRASIEESNRNPAAHQSQTYIKSIRYGNRQPYLPSLSPEAGPWQAPDDNPDSWMFEAVFDYGDHPGEAPAHEPSAAWPARADAFTGHRAGFEIRTYRLCRRVLMFHHFPAFTLPDGTDVLAAQDIDRHTLVRATEFGYVEPGSPEDPNQPGYTQLRKVTHGSFQRNPETNKYERRSLPPVSFRYSEPTAALDVRGIARDALPNLPVGTQGPDLQWLDLDGEGLSGVLTEQGSAWHYAPNLGDGRFGPMRLVAPMPAMASQAIGRQQWLDLDGDGHIELVDFTGPIPGFHARDDQTGWKQHLPFASLPNIDWQDPNLRFVDLTGDGHADALITEHDVFTWYPSLEAKGFAASVRSHQPVSEDDGPRLVFSDGTQTLFLADMCGDGLTDLVRIRNGDICYWPNLGYGRFGRKVTLGNAPRFDAPDLFDPRRIRLADIDGSGPVDLIYLGRQGAQLYFNRSGNRLSNVLHVPLPLATENLGAVQVADLMGNGTACLVWNSHLPADAEIPVRYVDLMGGQKPHLLLEADNNLGAVTTIEYTPSTRFYLDDLAAGEPWVTRLPFPVHCVSRVTVTDRHRGTTFASTTSYHHGYFDGVEREFRGFGRVEQVDTEDFGTFADVNLDSPYITKNHQLYQPPIKTVTWYHTGAALDRQRILTQFEQEYFPRRYAGRLAAAAHPFHEKPLPEPELPADLNAAEWMEALRACKGMVLRQESYELDLDELVAPSRRQVQVRLYSVATHNCHIQRLQARGNNRHAVFLVTESEAITYHHELDLRGNDALEPDPRIAHSLNLRHDPFGNVQQAISIAYPRRSGRTNAADPQQVLIDSVQAELHAAYAETRHTTDALQPERWQDRKLALRHHRLRQPCEIRTYEIAGLRPPASVYFDIDALRKLQLCEDQTLYPASGPESQQQALGRLDYHQQPPDNDPQPPDEGLYRRLVEHVRTMYFDDALDTQPPRQPLSFGQLGPRGLKFEDYKLALTDELLHAVFGKATASDPQADKLAWPIQGSETPRSYLDDPARSGYIAGTQLDPGFTGQYWMRSGTAGFAADAQAHFFLPERYIDPFSNTTELAYDPRDLYVASSRDAMGNRSEIARFDHRVLAPLEMVDANDNHSEVAFDVRGMPVATALLGKVDAATGISETGDSVRALEFDDLNPSDEDVADFFNVHPLDGQLVRTWLGQATSRFVYHFGAPLAPNGPRTAPGACGILREQHERDLPNQPTADPASWIPVQMAFEYSDGGGQSLVKKLQAEPAPDDTTQALRWITSGKTVLNNKGKPVRQYEPYFSSVGHVFEESREEGVSTTLFYDAAGRVVRTEMPDGTFSKVEFSPWFSRSFDANDTVLDSDWYRRRTDPNHPRYAEFNSPANQIAAERARQHANTPAETHFDSLGREVIAIAHNRTPDDQGKWQDEHHLTFTKLDAEGKPLWIRDALGHLVMQYISPPRANNASGETMPSTAAPCYDIAGNLLFQHSMDAGAKWTLNDAAGKPMFAWDVYKANHSAEEEKRLYSTEYDALHRPTAHKLKINNTASVVIEKYDYQDAQPKPANNLNSQLIRHYDASGLLEQVAMDFKGSPLEIRRRLVKDKTSTVTDWQGDTAILEQKLSAETFTQLTEYDALNRMAQQFNWHRAGKPVAVYIPTYSERGVLQSECLIVGAKIDNRFPEGFSGGTDNKAIKEIRYDAKGQRQYLILGNGTITQYDYDPETFRLRQLRTTRLKVAETDPGFPGFSANLADARVVQQLFYTYDPVGNIAEILDQAYKPVFFDNAIIEPKTLYEYDALYRLIWTQGRESAQGGEAAKNGSEPTIANGFPITDQTLRVYQQKYQYDAVGNFLSMQHIVPTDTASGWTRRYRYAFDDKDVSGNLNQPASNRLWRTWQGGDTWSGGTATNKVTYAYDSHGSMLNLSDVSDEFKMQWDHRDMIASINLGGGGGANYQYDAGKQRTRKIISKNNGHIVEERIYLGGLELYRRVDNGVLKEEIETLHLFDGEQRLLMVDQILETDNASMGKRTLYRYTLSNHLGSSTVELDEQAGIISYEEYHPYGTCAYRAGRNAAEVKLKRYRYTGMERDEESGLGYHTARYYLPWLGRWGSADPSGIISGLDIYGYADGDPVRFFDLTGLASGSPWWDDAKAQLKVGVAIEVRRLIAQFNIFNPMGPQQVQSDEIEAAMLIAQGKHDAAFEKATGFTDYFDIHRESKELNVSGHEEIGVMIGHASGLNQAAEAISGDSRSGRKMSTSERVMTGIDSGFRIINTVSTVAGMAGGAGKSIKAPKPGVSLPGNRNMTYGLKIIKQWEKRLKRLEGNIENKIKKLNTKEWSPGDNLSPENDALKEIGAFPNKGHISRDLIDKLIELESVADPDDKAKALQSAAKKILDQISNKLGAVAERKNLRESISQIKELQNDLGSTPRSNSQPADHWKTVNDAAKSM